MRISLRRTMTEYDINVEEQPPENFEIIVEPGYFLNSWEVVLSDVAIDEDYVYLNKEGKTAIFTNQIGLSLTEDVNYDNGPNNFFWDNPDEAYEFAVNWAKNRSN